MEEHGTVYITTTNILPAAAKIYSLTQMNWLKLMIYKLTVYKKTETRTGYNLTTNSSVQYFAPDRLN